MAHALESLPLISAAMARGELSYSKVRALTRVACAGTEAALLSVALHGTASHVETLVRHFRHVLEVAELKREARQYRNRSLSWRYEEDGSIVIKARLPAETGGLVMKALDAALEHLPLPDVSAETYPAPKPDWRSGGPMRSPYSPRAISRTAPRRSRAASASRSSCTSMRRRSRSALRVAASSRTARRSPPRRRDASPAMRAWCASSRTRAASRSTSAAAPVDPAGAAPCAQLPRPGLLLPRLHPDALRRRPPHPALGGGRRDEAREPGVALPVPSPPGARGRHHRAAARRRRLALHPARRTVHRYLRFRRARDSAVLGDWRQLVATHDAAKIGSIPRPPRPAGAGRRWTTARRSTCWCSARRKPGRFRGNVWQRG